MRKSPATQTRTRDSTADTVDVVSTVECAMMTACGMHLAVGLGLFTGSTQTSTCYRTELAVAGPNIDSFGDHVVMANILAGRSPQAVKPPANNTTGPLQTCAGVSSSRVSIFRAFIFRHSLFLSSSFSSVSVKRCSVWGAEGETTDFDC